MFIVHIVYLSPVTLLFVLVDQSQEVSSTSCFAVKLGTWFYMAIVLLFVQIFICFITVFIMFKLIMKKAFGHCNPEFTGGVCKIQKKMYFSTIVQVNLDKIEDKNSIFQLKKFEVSTYSEPEIRPQRLFSPGS